MVPRIVKARDLIIKLLNGLLDSHLIVACTVNVNLLDLLNSHMKLSYSFQLVWIGQER